MKKIIEKIIKIRNPHFQFDEGVDIVVIISLMVKTLVMFIRPLKYLLMGKNYLFVFMGTGVKIFNTRKVKLGKWVKLEDGVFLGGLGKGNLEIGERSGIGAYSRVEISKCFINLGASHQKLLR